MYLVAMNSPSEPNYIAALSGDFWGLGDDSVRCNLHQSASLAILIMLSPSVLPHSFKHHHSHRSFGAEEDLMGDISREYASHCMVDGLHRAKLCVSQHTQFTIPYV